MVPSGRVFPEVQWMASEGHTPALEAGQTGSESSEASAQGASGRARAGRIVGAIVIAVAVAAAATFALTAGVPDSEVVARVAAAQNLGATGPLAASGQVVAGTRTPDLGAYRWSPTGVRVDVVGTHTVSTAFFERGGRVIAASVVSGGAIREPGPVVATPAGVRVHRISLAGRSILSWRRGGRTVVLSSVAVPEPWLVALARALNTPSAPLPRG
jgi:hypothetical protein